MEDCGTGGPKPGSDTVQSVFNQWIGVAKMNKLIKTIKNGAVNFSRDEEGAQVVEYALIIAVVSIGLVVALRALGGTTSPFIDFITRVNTCLTTAVCV